MTDVAKLKAEWEKADKALVDLGNEYDAKRIELREKYSDRLIAANEKAVTAQKAYCDAEAAEGLRGRDDARSVAASLGLTEIAEELGVFED